MRCEYYILFTLLPAVISTQNTSTSSGRYQPTTDLGKRNSTCPAWTIPDQTQCECANDDYYNGAIACIAVDGSRPQVL